MRFRVEQRIAISVVAVMMGAKTGAASAMPPTGVVVIALKGTSFDCLTRYLEGLFDIRW